MQTTSEKIFGNEPPGMMIERKSERLYMGTMIYRLTI